MTATCETDDGLVLRLRKKRRRWRQGPYIKDVHTQGGGGVGPKSDVVREVAWI